MEASNKTKYRAVILILASNISELCKNSRKVWKSYMNIDPILKVYFVYGELYQPLDDFDPTSDLVFPDVKESYPVFIEKTIKAMEWIDSQHEYDFFIRTNLSTFWDFSKLHLHLNELPKETCYSGDGPLPNKQNGFYLSGTDTIVTPEMIKSMINNKQLVNYHQIEDAAMGSYFHGHLGVPMLPNRICFFEDIVSMGEYEKIKDIIIHATTNNCDHYRVKTLKGPRVEIDYFIYKILLQSIYNKQI
jgi:hypothetical protein